MKIVDDTFSHALQMAMSGKLTIIELIEAASRLSGAGETNHARELYKTWIDLNREHPQLYVAHFNRAALDSQAEDFAAARESLNIAIGQNPDFAPAYINLGRLLEQSGAPAQAVELWRTAASRPVPINGNAVIYAMTALKQIARVLSDNHQSKGAEEAIQRCLDINPQQSDIIEQYTAMRLAQCKWPIAVSSEHLDRKTLVKGIHPLSMAVYTDDPLLQLAAADRYVKQSTFEGPQNSECDRRHAAIDLSARRIRVGYVSSDLRDHAVGYLMAELFELHRKRDIEVFAYYCGPESQSALTARTKAAVEHWIDIRTLSDDDAAKKIAADGIDILVDVNGHTRDSRTGVFARRPAPIQVNWLGYPGSMGTPYHHYIIADDWIIPRGLEIYYSEKVVRLPCYQPNDRKRLIAAEKPTRRDAGLPDDAFVFCCFNGTHKISRFTFERWLEILNRVPDSVLWLLDTSTETKDRLGEYAEQKGVARARLIFAPRLHNPHHLARYSLADLFLDTVPYGAHTTASDALWMGVPVLTLSGRSFASRVCGSLVRAAGLADLVCARPEEYVERAVALGDNRSEIEVYKKTLEAGRHTCRLFDTGMLVDRLEDLYRAMCGDHQKGLSPQPDLTNLETYLHAGVDHDHEKQELLAVADYHGLYKAKLKRLHLARPMRADSRLWRAEDIAAAEGNAFEFDVVKSDMSAPDALRDLAASLSATGQGASAILLLQHLTAVHPGDIGTLRLLVKLLSAQGRTLESLEALLALKEVTSDREILLGEIRAAINPAIEWFNNRLAAGNVEQAAKCADALAALVPENPAVLNSVLACNIVLGRKDEAAKLAAALLRLDPAHEGARAVLAENCSTAPDVEGEVKQHADQAASNPGDIHPLIRLRDLHDAASSILCRPLGDRGAEQVEEFLNAARGLEIDMPKGSDWEGWVKHYRLAIDAIDLSAALGSTPVPSEESEIRFATSSGKPLDWSGVQMAAKKLGAQTVFFAAADRTYVDLYAHWYINSILEHCDVPCLVILHVIGGAGNLRDVAKSVGTKSERLIFAGDEFDAESVTTRCYDTPPKGLIARPVAHFQSVRFLWLGPLLQKLKLPVFVSDIDLILQRGVRDILQRCAHSDVVLNENLHSTNAGSRFTANLLLVNPTDNSALFLRFLQDYLERALRGSEVTRWIDQFGLMLAWHHLSRHGADPRIDYFDTSADINNVMYKAYQEHPFRFLSLYHGFDMSSLPAKSKVPVKTPARPRNRTAGRQKRGAGAAANA